MNWKNKKVLVTGAGGFVGSHLVERLYQLGAKVRAFVRYNSRADCGLLKIIPEDIRDKIEMIYGDLRDEDAVSEACRGVDIVFHLASLIAIPYSYIHPREVIESNVIGTLNVVNAVKQHKVSKLIHTSTSEVYGTAQYVPIDEKHPLQGQSPYSASKIAADKTVESFYLSFDIPCVTIRPFNVYGPRQSARAVIPTIIIQALRNNKVYLGALQPIRDFTFIEDTVDGFILMAEAKDIFGQVINIGSGYGVSVKELVKKIGQILGKKLQIIIEKERLRPEKSEVLRLIANNKKAKELIKWSPKRNLNDGLKLTVDWFKSNLQMYEALKFQI